MTRHERLEAKRLAVLEEMGTIRTLRKGTLAEQWFPVIRDGKKTKKLRGPYYVWTYKVGKKTISERITGARAVEQARRDAAAYKRFKELCREYEALTQQLGELDREVPADIEALKKGRTSRSSRTKK